jgi:hypothetical protein
MKDANIKKSRYSIEIILWEDHTLVERGTIPDNPDEFVEPTLSVGIVMKETDKTLILVNNIERFKFQEDNANYLLIYKPTIIGRKKFGKIEIANLT